MTSIDFAAAQQRIEGRRRTRAAVVRARFQSQRNLQASNALTRLPFPLNSLGQRGLQAWDAINGREGTKPAYRVGQVDAELLDEELLELLKGQVGEGLKFFGVRFTMPATMSIKTYEEQSHIRDDWSSEILMSLRAVLFKLSIWDNNASYGAALQNLRYTDARHRGPVSATPTKWQKGLYGVLTVCGRYGWTKWEDWLADHEGGYEEVPLTSRSVFISVLTISSQMQTFNCSPEYPPSPQPPIQSQLWFHFSSS